MSREAEPEVDFEQIYRRAGDDLEAVPWASLAPHPALLAWLELQPDAGERDALVVGCGLGDDAEALSHRGYRVSAFDIAPTAIARCRRPWPVSRTELRGLQAAGLRELEFREELPAAGRGRFLTAVYGRVIGP